MTINVTEAMVTLTPEHDGGFWLFDAGSHAVYSVLARAFPSTDSRYVPDFDALRDGDQITVTFNKNKVTATFKREADDAKESSHEDART